MAPADVAQKFVRPCQPLLLGVLTLSGFALIASSAKIASGNSYSDLGTVAYQILDAIKD